MAANMAAQTLKDPVSTSNFCKVFHMYMYVFGFDAFLKYFWMYVYVQDKCVSMEDFQTILWLHNHM